MPKNGKPPKCIVTKLGLAALLLAALSMAGIFIWQRIATGSFARGDGFVAPYFATVMLSSVVVGLALAMLGSVYDAIRFDKWKKSAVKE